MGLLASIQDAGRYGQLDYGVTQGGAMDGFAYRLGQRLVSNPANSAAIEIAMSGFCCRLIHDSTIAITGAIVNIHIDGQPQPMNNTLTVPGGGRDFDQSGPGRFIQLPVGSRWHSDFPYSRQSQHRPSRRYWQRLDGG